jgi:indole-3-glycerol phosphate synthase
MPSSRLDEIVANKRMEVEERKLLRSTNEIKGQAVPAQKRFLKAIREDGVRLVAEIKPKSPSAGVLRREISLDSILCAYDKYAAAISVLTDEKYFGGSLDLLEQVSLKSSRPALCKDFVIDPHQCFEARINGAEAVLLIVKILDPARLTELYETIMRLGMTAVVEVQTEDEMELALSLRPEVVLINNRDLGTFEIDLATTARLASQVPQDVTLISASGIESKADIDRLGSYCRVFLIGSALMKADSIEGKLAELAGCPALKES